MPRTRPYVFVPQAPHTANGSAASHTAPVGYPVVSWPTPRHTARWRDDEIDLLGALVTKCTRVTIARKLGRTPRAVEAMQQRRRGLCPTQQVYVTARQAALRVGLSPQYVETLCRRGRIKAHRVPGGRWWLVSDREIGRLSDVMDRRHPAATAAATAAGEPKRQPAPQPPPEDSLLAGAVALKKGRVS